MNLSVKFSNNSTLLNF